MKRLRHIALRWPKLFSCLYAHAVASYLSAGSFIAYEIWKGWPVTAVNFHYPTFYLVTVLPIWLPWFMCHRTFQNLFHHERLGLDFYYVVVVYPLIFFAVYRFKYRKTYRAAMLAEGNCQVCGYHLVATPLRCPECGTVPTKK